MSSLISKASNSISLEEHRKSMLAEGSRISTLINKLELKNDELHAELEQLKHTSLEKATQFENARTTWRNSAEAASLSIKNEQLNDMEDELANTLSMLETMKYNTNQDKIHILQVESLLKEKRNEANDYQHKWEQLKPKELTEEEEATQHQQQMQQEENKTKKKQQFHDLMNCIDYFGSTGLPALEEACEASSVLENVITEAASRALHTATNGTTPNDNVVRYGSTGGLFKQILEEQLNEQEARHRSEINELEKTSSDALQSMARGWADAKRNNIHGGTGGNGGQTRSPNEMLDGVVGQGPQVELFIWKAAMKVKTTLTIVLVSKMFASLSSP